jgi:hypothetical protein
VVLDVLGLMTRFSG